MSSTSTTTTTATITIDKTQRPRVIVFDLDGTIWEPEMYQLEGGGAPFTAHPTNPDIMLDRNGTEVRFIGESRAILQTLATDPKWSHTYLAISSTSEVPAWSKELLEKFTFENKEGEKVSMASLFGDRIEIYKASKVDHHHTILGKIRHDDPSVTDFSQILFFDNKMNNIDPMSENGISSCHCPNGMQPGVFEEGLKLWREAQKIEELIE